MKEHIAIKNGLMNVANYFEDRNIDSMQNLVEDAILFINKSFPLDAEVSVNLAGTVTGTCGHELRGVDDNMLTIKDHFNDYDEWKIKRCIAYVCVCDWCAKRYEKDGIVLHNEQEEKEWLNCDSQISD